MRIAVVAPSMGHNAVSRGWFLADMLGRRHEVELVGPLVAPWQTGIWPPVLASSRVQMRAFAAHDGACYLDEAATFARTIEADVVYVSKPRFPSALLGELAAAALDAPLLLDVDDDENSLSVPADWMRKATLDLVQEVAAVTVSSRPLQEGFGGTLVGQARDEAVFDPALYDRDQVRAELGFGLDDFVVLFLGTPWGHKGVLDVARAVEEIPDPRLRMCIIGSVRNRALAADLHAIDPRRLRLVESQPVSEVPRLLTAGDLTCLAQDVRSPVAQQQMPMKLTEALAMGVPVLATRTAAIEPLVEAGVVATLDGDHIPERIVRLLAEPHALQEQARRGRDYFLRHLGYGPVGDVLEGVLASLPGRVEPAPARDRIRVLAREIPACLVGGPFGHSEEDLALTDRLTGRLGRETGSALAAALGGARRCALLGYPNHRNPGDHAIWLAARRLLRDLEVEVEYVCDWQTYSRAALGAAVEAGAVIVLTGGGNFGDLWPKTQGLREQVLADFPGAPTIQLPQSIHFESEENRKRIGILLERHGDVRLMLRDRGSLELAQRWFDVPAELVPDLGFLTPVPDRAERQPTEDIVWVARTDKESLRFVPPAGTEGVQLCDWMTPTERDALPPRLARLLDRSAELTTRAAADDEVDPSELSAAWDRASRGRLKLACSVLSRGRVVVSDRLHVHVLCLLLGLPSVVGDNSYGKVSGVYHTHTQAAPLARWARTPAEALSLAGEVLARKRLLHP